MSHFADLIIYGSYKLNWGGDYRGGLGPTLSSWKGGGGPLPWKFMILNKTSRDERHNKNIIE